MLAALPCGICAAKPVKVALDRPANGETVEIPLSQLSSRLKGGNYFVTDADGREIPSQLTYDSLLVFTVNKSVNYEVKSDRKAHTYPTVCTGRLYPERADDAAWENNLTGYRVYGPATQRRGEKAYGYDIFLKHPTYEPIVESLYNAQCSGENWRKVDSLRKIDPKLAKDFENSFTYHLDHGKGMDCYAVGPTCGDGIATLVRGDSLCFAWCYDKAEVLEKGPVRFTLRLRFAPRKVEGLGDAITETRVITLDRDSHLNRCTVTYDGLDAPTRLASGFPLRDQSPAFMSEKTGIISYCDPTQGPDNGKAMLGVIFPQGFQRTLAGNGHALGYTTVEPGKPLTYYWGFAWDRADIPTYADWQKYLEDYRAALLDPVKYTLK